MAPWRSSPAGVRYTAPRGSADAKANIGITVEGIYPLLQSLSRFGKTVQTEIRDSMRPPLRQLVADVQANTPARTGSLRRSVDMELGYPPKSYVGIRAGGKSYKPDPRKNRDVDKARAVIPRALIGGREADYGYGEIPEGYWPILDIVNAHRPRVVRALRQAVAEGTRKTMLLALKKGAARGVKSQLGRALRKL